MTDPHARIAQLEAALEMAADRMVWLMVQFDTGTRNFITAGEWADEARAALSSAPAPDTTAGAVQEAARVLMRELGDYDRDRSHPSFEAAHQGFSSSTKPAPFNQIGDGLIAALRALAGETE